MYDYRSTRDLDAENAIRGILARPVRSQNRGDQPHLSGVCRLAGEREIGRR